MPLQKTNLQIGRCQSFLPTLISKSKSEPIPELPNEHYIVPSLQNNYVPVLQPIAQYNSLQHHSYTYFPQATYPSQTSYVRYNYAAS